MVAFETSIRQTFVKIKQDITALTNGKADKTAVVDLSTDQSINGVKTYASLPLIPTTTPTLAAQAASKSYVDSKTSSATPAKTGYGPSDHNLKAWTCDPVITSSASVLPTAGRRTGSRIYLAQDDTITNLIINIIVAGATLTAGQCFAEIFDSAGNRLGITADQATSWQSTGLKTMPLGTPVALTAGFYDVDVWYNGTTAPQLARGASQAGVNIGISGQALRFWRADTGQTTAALSPTTLGTKTGASESWWFGLS